MSTIILDLEANRVLAVEATLSGGRVNVVRAFTAEAPVSIRETSDPEEIGAWGREQLDEHRMKSRSAIVAAARAEVLVKRLEAPADALSRTERHEMICLQMSRQASLTSASSVIDYVDSDPSEDRAGFVVASAMPTERVRARTETAKAAGLRLEGIRLRTAGVRALIVEELDADRPTLLVNPGVGSVELLMLVGGEIVSSRSIAVPMPPPGDGPSAYAEKIAVEASRTLVSFRVTDAGGEIDRAVVLAGGDTGSALAEAVGERMRLPAQTLDPASLIDFDEGIDTRDYPAIAPLAGLLLCKPRGIRAHDFANPTAPPDTTAGLRQGVLAALLVIVVLAGMGYVMGRRAIGRAELRQAQAKEAYEQAIGKYVDAQLGGARLGHIRAWSADEIDWPAHLRNIVGLLPDAESVALGQFAVRLDATPRFEAGEQLKSPEAWGTSSVMTVTISGMARERDRIGQLRERLLNTGVYTVSSQGPEVEDRFSLQIATGIRSPDVATGEAGSDEPDADRSGAEVEG